MEFHSSNLCLNGVIYCDCGYFSVEILYGYLTGSSKHVKVASKIVFQEIGFLDI